MAAFSTTTDSTIEKITLLQAAFRGYLVRNQMNQVKTLYRDIVEDLEGKDSAEELQWSVYHGLALPVHKQKQSETELIMKRLREREASHVPEVDEEKEYSYSSASFETENSSSRPTTNTSGDETGSARLKVSLTQEGALSAEHSGNDGDKSLGVYSGGQSSNHATKSDRDKTVADHLVDSSESEKVSLTDRAAEIMIEQENTSSESTCHSREEAHAPVQEGDDNSKQMQSLSRENLSRQETGKSDTLNGFSSMNVKQFSMTEDKISQANSGEIDQRGRNVKGEDRFEMSRDEVGQKEWTDTKGEVIWKKMEHVQDDRDEDPLRNSVGGMEMKEGLSGKRSSSPNYKLPEKQPQRDTLERKEFSTRETTSLKNDNVKMNSNGREKNKVDLTSEETGATNLERESVARNLENDFQSVESQDERKQKANESGRKERWSEDGDTGIKRDVDEGSDNDGVSFIPPSPILPQGIPKKDNLVSSPLPPPSSTSPSDYPEKLIEDMKSLKDGQSECDAESTVLTKVTNMTSVSMWNDDTSVWNSEEDSPLDSPSLPENLTELQDLRKNIAMELLWVQQAIQSRKAYLRLRENLDNKAGD